MRKALCSPYTYIEIIYWILCYYRRFPFLFFFSFLLSRGEKIQFLSAWVRECRQFEDLLERIASALDKSLFVVVLIMFGGLRDGAGLA